MDVALKLCMWSNGKTNTTQRMLHAPSYTRRLKSSGLQSLLKTLLINTWIIHRTLGSPPTESLHAVWVHLLQRLNNYAVWVYFCFQHRNIYFILCPINQDSRVKANSNRDPPVWWTLISFRKLQSELTWLQRLQLELIILSSETAVWIYLSPTDNLQSHEFISYRNSSLNLSPTEILQSKFVSYRDSVVQLHLRVHLLQRLQSEFVSYSECSLSLSPTETAVWVCLLQRL